ncbi:DUF6350 family protein [Streptomyces sp. AK02-01A]|nr:DUF6350 family protein [Streptomyces sp. AK02-01A]MDX3852237.1 DUF6350 family protein [Streptomyces sp. AK02-01A]
MTQLTDRSPSLSSASAAERGRAAALTASFLRGVIAAVLGLGAFAVLVVAMWISSPYPDSGAGGALRIAAALWLLAHGVELVRPDSLAGGPAPLGVVPLLLSILPVWPAYRAARDALTPDEGNPQLTAVGVVCAMTGGYLLVGAVVVIYVSGGPLSAHPLRAALTLFAVTVAATGAGAWNGSGRPLGPPPPWAPGAVRGLLLRVVWARVVWVPESRRTCAVALRSGTAGALVLLGGGALFVGASLVWHGDLVHASFLKLAGDWSGRLAVLLLGLTLVPNAAVWGAVYALGPGFALGTASTATPFGVVGTPALPVFPLLAAVPDGTGTAQNWVAPAVPVLAGLAVAWFAVQAAAAPGAVREETWSVRRTALVAALGGVACSALTAFLAAMSGGPLGNADLAAFGPVWWRAGAAALAWTVPLAVPAALLLRAWRLWERGGEDEPGATRFARWREPWWPVSWSPLSWWPMSRWPVSWRPVPWRRDARPPAVAEEPAGAAPRTPVTPAATAVRPEADPADASGPDSEPYDFLPAGAWHERGAWETRRPMSKDATGGPTAAPPRPAREEKRGPEPAPPEPLYAKERDSGERPDVTP